MKVELHLHTSRYSPCGVNSPEEMMERLISTGYEATYITEHDTIWSEQELDELRSQFPEIAIFSGVEKSLDMQHLLILGAGEADRDYLKIEDPAEILTRASERGHATVLAHPFRWPGGADMLHDGVSATLPDAIEGRTPNHNSRCGDLSLTMASALSLPIVNTGDAHGVDFVNRFYIETDESLESANDIRKIIIEGKYHNFTTR